MVGIVLVSHSDKLVEGLKELVSQMASDVKIGIAGLKTVYECIKGE